MRKILAMYHWLATDNRPTIYSIIIAFTINIIVYVCEWTFRASHLSGSISRISMAIYYILSHELSMSSFARRSSLCRIIFTPYHTQLIIVICYLGQQHISKQYSMHTFYVYLRAERSNPQFFRISSHCVSTIYELTTLAWLWLYLLHKWLTRIAKTLPIVWISSVATCVYVHQSTPSPKEWNMCNIYSWYEHNGAHAHNWIWNKATIE